MSRVIKKLSFAYTKCVLKILYELKQTYETETLTRILTLFHESGVNILRSQTIDHADRIKNMQKKIERLCSATYIVQLLTRH